MLLASTHSYFSVKTKGRSRGRVQGVGTPTWDEAFFVFTFKICLPHQSDMPFLSGAPPPKKNPGSAPEEGISFLLITHLSDPSQGSNPDRLVKSMAHQPLDHHKPSNTVPKTKDLTLFSKF